MDIVKVFKDHPLLFRIFKDCGIVILTFQLNFISFHNDYYKIKYIHDLLMNGFKWRDTDQGFEYWCCKNDNFIKLLKTYNLYWEMI
jgi:hypothetical protein